MDNLEYEPKRIYQQTISSQPGDAQPNRQAEDSQLAFLDRLLSSVGEALVRTGSRLIERAHTHTTDEVSPPNFMIML